MLEFGGVALDFLVWRWASLVFSSTHFISGLLCLRVLHFVEVMGFRLFRATFKVQFTRRACAPRRACTLAQPRYFHPFVWLLQCSASVQQLLI